MVKAKRKSKTVRAASRRTPSAGKIGQAVSVGEHEERYSQAHRFLNRLFGPAVSSEARILIWPKGERGRFLASTEEAARLAVRKAKNGKDVYVGCGLYRKGITQGRGKAADVVCIRALWADLDCGKQGGFRSKARARAWLKENAPTPSVIVDSGRGLHVYWRIHPPLRPTEGDDPLLPRNWVEYLQRLASQEGIRLDAVGDLARVLRVAGTYNYKDCQPLPVRLRSIQRIYYSRSHFENLMKKMAEARDSRSRPQTCTPATLKKLKSALVRLSDQRATDYQDWLQVGMAIHSAFSGPKGFDLWEEFSKRTTKDNYDAKIVRSKWKTFKSDGGVSVATIYQMANEDSPPARGGRKVDDPHALADALLKLHFRHSDALTLRYYHGAWWLWEKEHYRQFAPTDLRASVNAHVRTALNGLGAADRKVNQTMVSNVIEAMAGKCLVHDTVAFPAWLGENDLPRTGDLLAMKGGLLDLEAVLAGESDCLRDPTPNWFCLTQWQYEYDPAARCPQQRPRLG